MIDILTFQHDNFVMWCVPIQNYVKSTTNVIHAMHTHYEILYLLHWLGFNVGDIHLQWCMSYQSWHETTLLHFIVTSIWGRARQWHSCCRVTMCFTRCFQTMRGRRFLKICHLRIQLWRFLKEWGRGHWYLVINQHVPQRFIQYPNHSSFKKAAS